MVSTALEKTKTKQITTKTFRILKLKCHIFPTI